MVAVKVAGLTKRVFMGAIMEEVDRLRVMDSCSSLL